MSAFRQPLVGVFTPEEDDSPSARSRRHRVGDAAVVVTAIAFGSTGLVTASQHGLGGQLRVESRPGNGTRITARIPHPGEDGR